MGGIDKVLWLAKRVWDTRPCDTDSSSSHAGKVPSMSWASVSPILDGQVWWALSIVPTLGGGE